MIRLNEVVASMMPAAAQAGHPEAWVYHGKVEGACLVANPAELAIMPTYYIELHQIFDHSFSPQKFYFIII